MEESERMSGAQAGKAPGGGPGAQGQAAQTGKQNDGSGVDSKYVAEAERHRFGIAMAVIAVFAIALVLSFNPSYAAQPSVVIAAFSGWIATMLTFYYTGQSVDAAVKQASDAKSSETATKIQAKDSLMKADVIKKKAKESVRAHCEGVTKKAAVRTAVPQEAFAEDQTAADAGLANVMKDFDDWDDVIKDALYKLA